jgi:hypothetical protein
MLSFYIMRSDGWQKFEDAATIRWMKECDKEVLRVKHNMLFQREDPMNNENYVTLYKVRVCVNNGRVHLRRIEFSNGEICDVVRTYLDRAPKHDGFWGKL